MSECTRRTFCRLVAATAAAALVPACGNQYDGTVVAAGGQATLTFVQFPALARVGGSAVVDVTGGNPLVVARTGATTAAATSALCTHQGCLLRYSAPTVHCDCHGADFALDGTVLDGPTQVRIKPYPASVAGAGIVVRLV